MTTNTEAAVAASDLRAWGEQLESVHNDIIACADRLTVEGGVDREWYMTAAALLAGAVAQLEQLQRQAAADAGAGQ